MTTKYLTKNQWTSHLSLSPIAEEIVFILSKYHFVARPWNARGFPTFLPRARPEEGLALGPSVAAVSPGLGKKALFLCTHCSK